LKQLFCPSYGLFYGRNSGTGAGIPKILAETAGVNTHRWPESEFVLRVLNTLKKTGRRHENRGAKFSVVESNVGFSTELGIRQKIK
jgi:hypothetical protein